MKPPRVKRFGKSVMRDNREIARACDNATAAWMVEQLHAAATATRNMVVNALVAGTIGCAIGLAIPQWLEMIR